MNCCRRQPHIVRRSVYTSFIREALQTKKAISRWIKQADLTPLATRKAGTELSPQDDLEKAAELWTALWNPPETVDPENVDEFCNFVPENVYPCVQVVVTGTMLYARACKAKCTAASADGWEVSHAAHLGSRRRGSDRRSTGPLGRHCRSLTVARPRRVALLAEG